MLKHLTAFNEMTSSAGNYLEQELGYAVKTTYLYRKIWRQVREFMFTNGITHYDVSVEAHVRFYEKLKGVAPFGLLDP